MWFGTANKSALFQRSMPPTLSSVRELVKETSYGLSSSFSRGLPTYLAISDFKVSSGSIIKIKDGQKPASLPLSNVESQKI